MGEWKVLMPAFLALHCTISAAGWWLLLPQTSHVGTTQLELSATNKSATGPLD